MSDNLIYIPFPRKLYDDIVRFSDGGIDPAEQAAFQVHSWVQRTFWDEPFEIWGDRAEEAAEEWAPEVLERWQREDKAAWEERRAERKPLVWKEVAISAGSEVRMHYRGDHHYAEVKGGRIVDDGKEYSPSEWASKVADGTTRNAWRDLWFKEPLSKTWVPAQLLRDQAIEELKRRRAAPDAPND